MSQVEIHRYFLGLKLLVHARPSVYGVYFASLLEEWETEAYEKSLIPIYAGIYKGILEGTLDLH